MQHAPKKTFRRLALFLRNALSWLDQAVGLRRLQQINLGLTVLTLVLAVGLLVNVLTVSPQRYWDRQMAAASDQEKNKTFDHVRDGFWPKKKPVAYYLEPLGQRDIFSSAPVKRKASAATASLSNYSLVGILRGENPQVILEDKTTQMTYYLSKGQDLGGVVVLDIQEKNVVLKCNGETTTLTL